MVRTSVDIPEDLYRAFQKQGGVLSVVVREAIRDWLGVKGASEDALAVLDLRHERLIEEKLRFESKLREAENKIDATEIQIKQVKAGIQQREMVNKQAEIMRKEVNPYIRNMDYKIVSMTPELHELVLKLREVGLEHTLESLQKHARRLSDADYLGGYSE